LYGLMLFSLGYLPKCASAKPYKSMFIIWGTGKWFSQVVGSFYNPTSNVWGLQFYCLLPWVWSSFDFHFSEVMLSIFFAWYLWRSVCLIPLSIFKLDDLFIVEQWWSVF
jgi:hypothetical protein